MMTEGDRTFIAETLMPYFGIEKLQIEWSDYSKTKYPDIWYVPERPPKIVVTAEWRRQSMHERRKRLVHEALHIDGLRHGKHNGYDYNTKPALDSYSVAVYEKMRRTAL